MFLLVGLGNPGTEYAMTRHNIGFLFLDHLAARHGMVFKGSKWQADTAKGSVAGQPVLLCKPQTYMNRSGNAVGQVVRFHDLAPSEVVVVHDDLDLPFGRLKLVANRGAGGHNGIKSIIDHLGTRDFPRIRVGVGRPPGETAASDYVLARFSKEEQQEFPALFARIEEAVERILADGLVRAMNAVNSDEER
ncbi:MAG: aminoacyl-tRNA hydrolase [Thermodesulfobacteriota bacterium]